LDALDSVPLERDAAGVIGVENEVLASDLTMVPLRRSPFFNET
jgi:hypothetical protein